MDLPTPPNLMCCSINAKKHSSKGFFKEDLDSLNLLKENEVFKQLLDEKTCLINRIFYEYLQKHNEMRFVIEKLNDCYERLGLSFEDEPRLKLIYEHRFDTFELKEQKGNSRFLIKIIIIKHYLKIFIVFNIKFAFIYLRSYKFGRHRSRFPIKTIKTFAEAQKNFFLSSYR